MSAVEEDVLGRFLAQPPQIKGPVTASRHRRNAVVYLLLVLCGLAPTWLGLSPSWQAAGLGLLLPGGGFPVAGGATMLLLPLTLAVFWLACIAWFWAGMVIAPVGIWLGAALLAAHFAGADAWSGAAWLTPGLAVAVLAYYQYRASRRQRLDRAQFEFRQGFFTASRAEVSERAVARAAEGERELDEEQLKALRYVFDRALQPVGEYAGYTIIDQFQPAALRYQINHMGFALAIAQRHYAPSFSGYLLDAQQRLVETYLDPKVWSYWVLESMWGHLNFTNFDPAAKDNIMLTGWYGMHVNGYHNATGDRRYGEAGSLTFRLNERQSWAHDAHTLAQSLAVNFDHSDFFLYPCEPNWVYPICNMYGMASLAAHDAVFDSDYLQRFLPTWLERLESEFTDGKGSIIGLRSYWTGLEVPFYAGEAGFAFFANVFSPSLARRLWAVGRKELELCLATGQNGQPRISIPREALAFIDTIDPGNYRPGSLFPYAAIAISGREFGDNELAEAALHSMDEDCGREEVDGVVSYRQASTLANVWAVEAKLSGTEDFRNAFVKPLPDAVARGPRLAQAAYPEVLVAKAYSDGEQLDLVLYPGRAHGTQPLTLERLRPGRTYRIQFADGTSELCADGAGTARVDVDLRGRTALSIAPV